MVLLMAGMAADPRPPTITVAGVVAREEGVAVPLAGRASDPGLPTL